MQKTKIEWCDYTINPVKGLCPMACSYCYARAMYKRFKWNPEIKFNDEVFLPLVDIKKPSRVFVGSTMELFGDWVTDWEMRGILGLCGSPTLQHHTFIFLTKQPQNLIKFSPFPDNCWVGMSVTRGGIGDASAGAIPCFEDIEAKVKFVSFEPLLSQIEFDCYTDFVDWVIIGAQTPRSEKAFPKWSWVREIIEAADKASIPVFLKPNLGLLEYSCEGSAPFYKRHQTGTWKIRQEMPG
uniref:DUF5131 family protein n=1 Tax=viral metagenome TaxID=1070528 RepID=A0A6M3J573_9ZZZZ